MAAPLPIVLIIGVLGLAIGSFLNVVIYRVPREESILYPSSHCPTCQAQVRAWQNIPVISWLILRGKCAGCKSKISLRYPLVELATCALFVAITVHFGLSADLSAYLYLAAIAVALAMIDFDVQRLPDSIVLPSYVVGVLLLMPAGAADADWWSAVRALIAMAALWIFYAALAFAYPHGVDFNNVTLAGLLGLYLGWLSWGTVLIGAFGGFLIVGLSSAVFRGGSAFRGGPGVPAVAEPRARLRSALPLGPCMISASVLALFVTTPITAWYGSLLHIA